jgi:hypothetical protein
VRACRRCLVASHAAAAVVPVYCGDACGDGGVAAQLQPAVQLLPLRNCRRCTPCRSCPAAVRSRQPWAHNSNFCTFLKRGCVIRDCVGLCVRYVAVAERLSTPPTTPRRGVGVGTPPSSSRRSLPFAMSSGGSVGREPPRHARMRKTATPTKRSSSRYATRPAASSPSIAATPSQTDLRDIKAQVRGPLRGPRASHVPCSAPRVSASTAHARRTHRWRSCIGSSRRNCRWRWSRRRHSKRSFERFAARCRCRCSCPRPARRRADLTAAHALNHSLLLTSRLQTAGGHPEVDAYSRGRVL